MAAKNLTDLFNTRVFRIPDYQRDYAWVEKQLTELWDDLDEIQEVNGGLKKHYTGTIFLEETKPDEIEKWLSGVTFYNVVDGQQRLTSICILLFELLKVAEVGYAEKKKEILLGTFIFESNLSGESRIYKLGYAANDKNYKFLQSVVFEDKGIVLETNYLNHHTKNLLAAKDFFHKKIALLNGEQRNLLFRKITASLQFDIRTIEKDLDVQAVFETMNNRGKPLSTLEKLKNRLIYLTEKLVIASEDRQKLRIKINEAWGKIYNCLAQNPDQMLDEDVFLSAHLSLYRKPKDSTFSEKQAEEKVFQMFCNKPEKYDMEEGGEKEPPITYQKIIDYIVKLSELAPLWYKIHNSKSGLIKRILTQNSSKDIKIFLTAVKKQTSDATIMQTAFENLEKILFRNRLPGAGIMDERKTAYWARDIYNGEESIQKVIQKEVDFLNMPISVQGIVQSFKQQFNYERGPKGFHRWNNLKYFLFEYEEFLKKQAKETDTRVTIDDFDKTSIEHIVPQNFRVNWGDTVQDVVKNLTEPEKIAQAQKVLINTLGNLTILKNGKNSSLGNKSWFDKKERFRTGSYNEIAISKHDNWTKDSISQRGRDMLEFLETKISGLYFSEQEIENILFYDDYIVDIISERSQKPIMM
jgi:uncharacterized protein with ParB-like and HNH nuclease domain